MSDPDSGLLPANPLSISHAASTKAIDDQRRIAQLEQEVFSVVKQLDESKDLLSETRKQNAQLKDQANSLQIEKLERAKYVQNLERNRDESIVEKTELQNTKIMLQSQKDSFEAESAKLLNEKRHLTDELISMRTDFAKSKKEQCLLQMKIDEFNTEKSLIAYDKERWSREKEILVQGKQWCMNEISNREMKLNELRIEMIKLEAKMQRDKFTLSQDKDMLSIKVEEQTEAIAKKEDELAEIKEQVRQLVDQRATSLNEMDAELRAKERLTEVYKTSLEAANHEICNVKQNLSLVQCALQEGEMNVVNLNAEIEKITSEMGKDIKEKDATIKLIKEELEKANELLKMGSKIHRTDEEISALSPAAAAASSLLKSGISLTSIYAEHCRVVAELEKKKAENEQIERYVAELIEELDAKAPLFKQQREVYEAALEEIEQLRLQNTLLTDDRQKLQGARDSATRELSYTSTELERYQHEHQIQSAQIKRLLFCIEKRSPDGMENNGSESDEYLFNNIVDLQQRNMELISKLKRVESEQQHALLNYQSAENESLTIQLNATKEELGRLRQQQSKLELLVDELTAQRDNYKAMMEESVSRTVSPPNSAVNERHSLDKTNFDMAHYKQKAEFLQEKLDCFSADKQQMYRSYNQRIDQQMEQIAQLRTNNGKLESSLEFQKKNQQLLNKQVTELEKDLKKANEASSKLTVRLESLQIRYDDMTNQLLSKQQELARLKVMNHSLEDQLSVSRSNEQRCTTELGILRETNFNSERVALTLQEVENVLKRVDAKKTDSIMSQLQSACLERDNLKNLVDNLNRQNTQLTNNLKLNLNSVTSERDRALLDCKAMKDNIAVLEMSYKQLKETHEKLSSESLALQPTDSDIDSCKKEIQQLKNKTAYQEKQIAELMLQCDQLKKTVELKEKELMDVCSLSGNMENVIREQNEYGELERQRLQAMCNQSEQDMAMSKNQIEELRNNVADLEFQLLEKSRVVELSESRFQDSEVQYQQNKLEFEENSRKNQEVMEQLQQVMETIKSDFENHKQKNDHLLAENAELTQSLTREQSKTEELSKQLAQLRDQLNVETTKLKNKVDMLEQEKLHLNELMADYSNRDQDNLQKTNTLYDEIQKLVQQIAFMEQMQCSMPESANTTLNTSSMSLPDDDDPQQASRLSAIIGYMRLEKQKETEMRMNAELDLQRLKAKASIDQQKIISLECELTEVRNVANANAQAAQQNEQLVSELGLLKLTQERYALLKKEATELQAKYTTMEKKAKELAALLTQARNVKAQLEGNLNAALAEVEARKKENTSLRERNEQVMALASKYSPEAYSALMGDFERQKQVLNKKEQELKILKTQLEKCTDDYTVLKLDNTEKANSLTKNSQVLFQTKTLARNYRDQFNKLEQEKLVLEEEVKKLKAQVGTFSAAAKASSQSSGSPITANTWSTGGTANVGGLANFKRELADKIREISQLNATNKGLQAKVEELEKERQQLQEKIAKLQADFDEANEKNFRLDSLSSMLTSSKAKLNKLQEEMAVKEAEIQELKQRLNAPSLLVSRKRNLSAAECAAAVPNETERLTSQQAPSSLEENATKRSRLIPPMDEGEQEEAAVNIDEAMEGEAALLDIEPKSVATLDENITDAAGVEEMMFSQTSPAEEAFMETAPVEPAQTASSSQALPQYLSTTQAFFSEVLEDAVKDKIDAEGGFIDDDMIIEEAPSSFKPTMDLNEEEELEQPETAQPIVEQPDETEEELAEEGNSAPYNLPDRFYDPLPNDPAMDVSGDQSADAAQSNAEELNLELAEDADPKQQEGEQIEEEETEHEGLHFQDPNNNNEDDEEAQEVDEDTASYELVANEAEEVQEAHYEENDEDEEEYDEEEDEENVRQVDEDEVICLSDDEDEGVSNSADPSANSQGSDSQKK